MKQNEMEQYQQLLDEIDAFETHLLDLTGAFGKLNEAFVEFKRKAVKIMVERGDG